MNFLQFYCLGSFNSENHRQSLFAPAFAIHRVDAMCVCFQHFSHLMEQKQQKTKKSVPPPQIILWQSKPKWWQASSFRKRNVGVGVKENWEEWETKRERKRIEKGDRPSVGDGECHNDGARAIEWGKVCESKLPQKRIIINPLYAIPSAKWHHT